MGGTYMLQARILLPVPIRVVLAMPFHMGVTPVVAQKVARAITLRMTYERI